MKTELLINVIHAASKNNESTKAIIESIPDKVDVSTPAKFDEFLNILLNFKVFGNWSFSSRNILNSETTVSLLRLAKSLGNDYITTPATQSLLKTFLESESIIDIFEATFTSVQPILERYNHLQEFRGLLVNHFEDLSSSIETFSKVVENGLKGHLTPFNNQTNNLTHIYTLLCCSESADTILNFKECVYQFAFLNQVHHCVIEDDCKIVDDIINAYFELCSEGRISDISLVNNSSLHVAFLPFSEELIASKKNVILNACTKFLNNEFKPLTDNIQLYFLKGEDGIRLSDPDKATFETCRAFLSAARHSLSLIPEPTGETLFTHKLSFNNKQEVASIVSFQSSFNANKKSVMIDEIYSNSNYKFIDALLFAFTHAKSLLDNNAYTILGHDLLETYKELFDLFYLALSKDYVLSKEAEECLEHELPYLEDYDFFGSSLALYASVVVDQDYGTLPLDRNCVGLVLGCLYNDFPERSFSTDDFFNKTLKTTPLRVYNNYDENNNLINLPETDIASYVHNVPDNQLFNVTLNLLRYLDAVTFKELSSLSLSEETFLDIVLKRKALVDSNPFKTFN